MNSPNSFNATSLELPPSKKSKQANISFISKMQQILKDQECRSYVQWSEEGTSFHIQSNTEFTNYVLPKYFKHKNFNSFVRQLNMYGFRKTKTKEEGFESTYSHHLFKRSENSVVHKIKRLQPKKSESEDEENEYFIEKYSGTRNAKKTEVAQNSKFGALSKQLSKLTEKFRDFEDVADDLKSTIAMQNNQIKIMASELLRLRTEGENQYKDLLAQFSSLANKNKKTIGGSEPFLTEPQDPYATQQHIHETGLQNLSRIGETKPGVSVADYRKYHPKKNLREMFEPNLPTADKHGGIMRKQAQNQRISRTIAVNDTYYFDCNPNQQQNYETKGEKLQSYESHLLEEPSQVTGERESYSPSNEYEEEEQRLGQQRGYLVDDTYYGEGLPTGSFPYKMHQKTRNEGRSVPRDLYNDASNIL